MQTSHAMQDYLKAIYVLGERGGKVTTTEIARRLGVSAPSATNMVQKLAEMKLVDYSRYHGVRLRPAGKKIALEILRHHRLLELYLTQAMGYPWDRVHEEAERMEHVISEEFEDRISEILGHPTTDPHGHPIPGKEGTVEATDTISVADVEPGKRVTLRRVPDRDPELLRYLDSLGLRIGVKLEVVEQAPFNGPITIRVGESEHHLGRELASHLFVTVD
jgi:DtxR family Mn-dependent transcriptional regulator